MNGLSAEPGERSRLRHVDLAGAALIEIVGRGDAREHLAGRVIDHEDRDRNVGAERARALARQFLQALLQARVDGQRDAACCRRGRHHLVGRMRRQHRHRPAAGGHRLALGARDLVRAECRASRRDAVEHAVARAARAAPRAVGPALLRRLRQRHQQRRLARASAGAAPCRNRPARPRGCLRDCRHRAPSVR